MAQHTPIHLKVFISSPGDVATERAIAREVIYSLQRDPLLQGQVIFDVLAWDDPEAVVPLLAGESPQTSVDRRLEVSRCDIVIVILWQRMGTPLNTQFYQKEDGSAYLSGTEYEYWQALQSFRRTGKPEIVVYRRKDENTPPDEDQYKNLQAFIETISATNEYTLESFKDVLEANIKHLVRATIEREESLERPFINDLSQPNRLALVTPSKYPPEFIKAFVGNPSKPMETRLQALAVCFHHQLVDDTFLAELLQNDPSEILHLKVLELLRESLLPIKATTLALMMQDRRASVAKEAVLVAGQYIKAGHFTSSLMSYVNAYKASDSSRTWEVTMRAVKSVIASDDDESFDTLMGFRNVKYHITIDAIREYVTDRHTNQQLSPEQLAQSLELLQHYLSRIDKEISQKKLEKTISILQT